MSRVTCEQFERLKKAVLGGGVSKEVLAHFLEDPYSGARIKCLVEGASMVEFVFIPGEMVMDLERGIKPLGILSVYDGSLRYPTGEEVDALILDQPYFGLVGRRGITAIGGKSCVIENYNGNLTVEKISIDSRFSAGNYLFIAVIG